MHKRALLFCSALSVALIGCDLLSTRTPQSPSQQSSFQTPTAAYIVWQNFQDAINNRQTSSYTQCFADSSRGASVFRFFPAADAQIFSSTFQTWSVKEETSYFISLNSQVPSSAVLSVQMDSVQIESGASDSTVYDANYLLIAKHNDPTKPTQSSGRMHVTIKPDPVTQLWAITQWIDVATSSTPSWSVMKARFSQ